MTHPYPILLVAHRGLGEGLLTAAEAILGRRPEVDHVTNDGLSPETLAGEINRWLEAHPGPVLILTDLGFGSCCQTARRASRERTQVGILAGVNLPVLLAAVRSSVQEDLASFLRHLHARGQGSVEMYLGGEHL